MGGKSGGDAKMIVTRYYLSGHWGICQKADAIRDIRVGEKIIWKGMARNNGTINVAREGLFGGMKKEGGVKGGIDVMLGGDNQVPPQSLIRRLGVGASNVPGFRGITSLMFHGGAYRDADAYGDPIGGDGGSDYGDTGKTIFGMSLSVFARLAYKSTAWYWGTQPYLKPLWVTVQRIPGTQLDETTAPIPRGSSNAPTSLYVELDDSGSMDELTSNGKTRRENMQVAMHLVLDQLAVQVGQGQRIDLGMSRFNGGKLERPSLTASGITDFRNFIDAIPPNGGSTPFDAPIQDAVNWFEATRNDPALVNRINFFVTDGEPNPLESADAAETLAQELLDRTIPVDMWGVNIDLANTQFTEQLHNVNAPVPVVSGGNSAELASIIQSALQDIKDANPAHMIYECLTDTDWGMGADPEAVDFDSFKAAGETLYDEVFGVAMAWMAQSSIEDFINDVLAHIHGAIFPHPRTGKITLKLLRDDLDLPNLKTVTPDNATLTSFSRKGWGETTNEIVVTWTNPVTEKEETVFAQDLANIAQQGGVVSSSKNYHGVRTVELANRLAERDLREESAPLCSCEVEVNREFWDVVPFEGVKVTWPEYGLNELVMRVMKVNYGDSSSSAIKLSLVEDVFSLPLASYIPPVTGEWEDPAQPPVPVSAARLMPPPAYVVSRYGVDLDTLTHPDTGVVPMAVNPTTSEGASYDVLQEEATASGTTSWAQVLGSVPFLATAELPADTPAEVQTTGLLLGNLFGEEPTVEDLLLIGDDELADDELELALVTATDPETGEITLRRGVLDTVPVEWPAGTKVAVTRDFHWRPIPRTFVDGQSVTLKFLVETSAGLLEEYETPEFTGQATSRAVHPTRPANLRAFGELYPDPDYYPVYPVEITWSHRNRLLEDAIMLAWDEGDTPAEAGVEYRVLIEAVSSTGEVDGVIGDLVQTGTSYTLTEGFVGAYAASLYVRVSVWALRDGLQSWQAGSVLFRGPFREPYDLSLEYYDFRKPYGVTAAVTGA
ncbi:phage tail protein [Halomonas sp.]|uniref:phage tail protein n=1 Tax=Halomonas sp. TaxID=1486246 RepID=UPI00298E3B1D|nr:phage tail protein [Halomonas sp.]MDW7746594.1 phage tail protein [Halomonas sp.]